jgi:hypothetical protein
MAAAALAAIETAVGGFEQFLRRAAILRVNGHANADGQSRGTGSQASGDTMLIHHFRNGTKCGRKNGTGEASPCG